MSDNQPTKKQKIIRGHYNVMRGLTKMFCYAAFRIRLHGVSNVPKSGPFLLLSNHQSFLDPMFVSCGIARKVRFVARASLYESKFWGAMLRQSETIPIKRGQADMAAVKEILKSLNMGLGVGLFPEGTRCRDGRITEMKPGFGLLTKKSKAPIIPVVVEGAYECWPRHRKVFLPGEVTICYGKPIAAEETAKMDSKSFAKMLTDTLRSMQNKCRKELGKEPFDYN